MMYFTRIATVLFLCGISEAQQGLSEYCLLDTFMANCAQNEVIKMETAKYGRMKEGRCINGALSAISMGCYTDALPYLDSLCSGRRVCSVATLSLVRLIPTAVQECPLGVTSYLQANYTCKKVLTSKSKCQDQRMITLQQNSGLLSSFVTKETKLGSAQCPWRIEAKAGQTIEFSLTKYGIKSDSNLARSNKHCTPFLFFQEVKGHESKTVCEKDGYHRDIYTSKSGSVDVKIVETHSLDDSGHFLLHFDVKGCPDINPPMYGWLARKEDTISWGCYNEDTVWNMTCADMSWSGEIRNCTQPKVEPMVAQQSSNGGIMGVQITERFLPMMLVASLTLLVVASFVVVIGMSCLGKQWKSHKAKLSALDLAYKLKYESAPLRRYHGSQKNTMTLPTKMPPVDETKKHESVDTFNRHSYMSVPSRKSGGNRYSGGQDEKLYEKPWCQSNYRVMSELYTRGSCYSDDSIPPPFYHYLDPEIVMNEQPVPPNVGILQCTL